MYHLELERMFGFLVVGLVQGSFFTSEGIRELGFVDQQGAIGNRKKLIEVIKGKVMTIDGLQKDLEAGWQQVTHKKT